MHKVFSSNEKILQNLSLSTINAGFVTVLVGFTGSIVIVIQAAQTIGATPEQISSWVLSLCVGMGTVGVALSIYYKTPITTAWSTSGAAMLVAGASGFSLQEATGAFIVTGILITISGFSGLFERIMKKIPMSLAAAMLSGIILSFGIDAFSAMKTEFLLVFSMFVVYAIARSIFPRYCVLFALLTGCAIAVQKGLMASVSMNFALAKPVFVMPVFSAQAIIGISIPLFIVTMASQNLPGLTVLKASDYKATPVSPLVGWTGIATTLLAVFGAFTINLATITSAICIGKEAHPNPKKRYVAAIFAGIFYILAGLLGTAVVTIFTQFPVELILAIAGLALLSTIGNTLLTAVKNENEREAAIVTFLITASGISFWGIGSALWGVLAGAFLYLSHSHLSHSYLSMLPARKQKKNAQADFDGRDLNRSHRYK